MVLRFSGRRDVVCATAGMVMSITVSKPRHLPAYKVNTFQSSVAPITNSTFQLGFTAYNWAGVPISNHLSDLPILYHHGSWRAYNKADPTVSSDTLTDPVGGGGTETFTQYGTRLGTSGSLKRPTAVLYNCELYPNTTGSSTITQGLASEGTTAFAGVLAYLATQSTALTAVNACTCPIWSQSTRNRFMVLPFLCTSWAGSNSDPVILNEERFEGGDLLVLYAAYANSKGAGSASNCDYVTTAGVERTALTVPEAAALGRAYARFKSFKAIIYVRRWYTVAAEQATYDAVGPTLFGLASAVSPYNMTLKGPYEATTDISATVESDVASWLAGL